MFIFLSSLDNLAHRKFKEYELKSKPNIMRRNSAKANS